MDDEGALQRSVNQRIDRLIPHQKAWASTVIIVVQRGDRLATAGTGTLFQLADEAFVVTAAHVLKKALEAGQKLGIGPNKGQFVPLRGQLLLGDAGQSDVGLVRMSSQDVTLIDRPFLRVHDVCFDFEPSESIFTLFGFPEMWCAGENGTFRQTRFHFTTHGCQDQPSGLGFDDEYHFSLMAKVAETTDINGAPLDFAYRNGVSAPFPKELHGMSGCSVWKIADERSALRQKTPENARIVGVQIAVYHEAQCIKVTRWEAVRRIIYDAIPELRGPLTLWRGQE